MDYTNSNNFLYMLHALNLKEKNIFMDHIVPLFPYLKQSFSKQVTRNFFHVYFNVSQGHNVKIKLGESSSIRNKTKWPKYTQLYGGLA